MFLFKYRLKRALRDLVDVVPQKKKEGWNQRRKQDIQKVKEIQTERKKERQKERQK